MEDSVLSTLNDALKEAALASFVNFRDSYAWKLEHENKILGEYKNQYENQLSKCLELENSLKKYKDLIIALGGKPDGNIPYPEPTPNPTSRIEPVSNADLLPKTNPNPNTDYIITPKKKLQYPSSPKAKLQELVTSTHYFKSDQELLNMLSFAFDLPNIPMKTVQNYLLELQAEGVFKRVKSRKLNQYITGPVEWFDEFGVPKPDHLRE